IVYGSGKTSSRDRIAPMPPVTYGRNRVPSRGPIGTPTVTSTIVVNTELLTGRPRYSGEYPSSKSTSTMPPAPTPVVTPRSIGLPPAGVPALPPIHGTTNTSARAGAATSNVAKRKRPIPSERCDIIVNSSRVHEQSVGPLVRDRSTV